MSMRAWVWVWVYSESMGPKRENQEEDRKGKVFFLKTKELVWDVQVGD